MEGNLTEHWIGQGKPQTSVLNQFSVHCYHPSFIVPSLFPDLKDKTTVDMSLTVGTSSTSVGTTLGTAPTPTPTSTAPQSMTSTSRPRPAVFVVTAVDLHNLNETPSWATTGAPSTTPASVDAITMSPPVGTTTRWTLPPAWTASPDRDADVNGQFHRVRPRHH